MSPSTRTWIGQVTTGHGFMVLMPTLLALVSGTITMDAALPLLAGSIIGLLWPENVRLKQAAQTVTTDLESAVRLYRGSADTATPNTPTPPDPRPGAAALLVLTALSLTLAACAGQTEAQKAATVQAVASGLQCIANTTNKVVGVGADQAPNAVKTTDAIAAVSTELANDPSCGTAIMNATKAVPVTPAPHSAEPAVTPSVAPTAP